MFLNLRIEDFETWLRAEPTNSVYCMIESLGRTCPLGQWTGKWVGMTYIQDEKTLRKYNMPRWMLYYMSKFDGMYPDIVPTRSHADAIRALEYVKERIKIDTN